MAWQCTNWASAQDIPNRSKLLLIILANHANGESGHSFCSIEFLMKETSYSRSAIYGFLSMLKRNGYITVRKAKGCGRAPDIWVNMDRAEAPWIGTKAKATEPEDIPDIEASPENGLPETVENEGPESKEWTTGVQSLDENGGHTLYGEPSYIEPSAGARNKTAPAPPPKPQALGVVSKSYDHNKRDRELERLKAADEARQRKHYPVIKGTRWWNDLLASGHPPDLVGTVEVDGKRYPGWYSKTPPPFNRSTGPPIEGAELADELDETEVVE